MRDGPTPDAPLPVLLWHLGRRGGGPRYTLELARALAARPELAVHLCLSRQSELYDETAALGLPLLAVDTYTDARSALLGLPRIPRVARSMADHVTRHRIPVALCTMSHLWNGWLAPSLRRAGAANLLVMHDARPHPGESFGLRPWLMRRDVRQADGIVTLTGAVRDLALSLYPEMTPARTAVVPMGPFGYGPGPAAAAPRVLPSDRPARLLFFGRLLPYKGLDRLLPAVAALREAGRAVELTLAGSGALGDLAVPEGVTVLNRWIDEADIPGLFEAADLVVLPYTEASQSGVLPIAANYGIPAVVTPIGGLAEQVGHGTSGLVAADTSAGAIAGAIGEALEPGRYAALSRGALDAACAWPEIATRMAAVIGAAAHGRAIAEAAAPGTS